MKSGYVAVTRCPVDRCRSTVFETVECPRKMGGPGICPDGQVFEHSYDVLVKCGVCGKVFLVECKFSYRGRGSDGEFEGVWSSSDDITVIGDV